jgi:hypothetical protein
LEEKEIREEKIHTISRIVASLQKEGDLLTSFSPQIPQLLLKCPRCVDVKLPLLPIIVQSGHPPSITPYLEAIA